MKRIEKNDENKQKATTKNTIVEMCVELKTAKSIQRDKVKAEITKEQTNITQQQNKCNGDGTPQIRQNGTE